MWWKLLLAASVAIAVSAQDSDPVAVDCSSVSYGFFSLENDCSKFVFCNDGTRQEFNCRDDEIWSQPIGACVLGYPETCQEWSPELACDGNTKEIVVPHPRDCGKFVLCGANGAELKECEPGLIFEEDRCVVGNLDECKSYEPLCGDAENGFLEHPDWCEAFIMCEEEDITLEFCPDGEIFRIDLKRCVLGEVEKCEPLPIKEMCKNRSNQTLVHPERCESFVMCEEDEEARENDCPRGEIFNPTTLTCELGDRVRCTLLDQVCMDVVGEIFEHPNECDLHIDCTEDGIAQLSFCSFGRIWRQDMMMCVPGDRTTCERAPFESMCDNQPYGAVFPHPDGCSVLVQCTIIEAIKIPCPAHHILQPGTLDCILGNQKSCKTYNEVCENKEYEAVVLPDTCDAFIFCYSSLKNPELRFCPPGDIITAELGKCSPGDSETCELLECYDSDGLTRHPNFCNIFTRCYNGKIFTQFCPIDHIFHETMKLCTPGRATECTYDPLEEMCKGRYNGMIYPYPSTDNQCKEYVLCMDGLAEVQSCPEGMVLRPENLDCVPGDEQTCDVLDIVCLADEVSVIVHPSRCDVKITCNNGTFAVEACPTGEIVDPVELICIPGNCPDRENFVSNIGICFPGTVLGCAIYSLKSMCQDREDDSIYPVLNDCSHYITCTNNQAIKAPCERGNIYSPSQRRCLAGSSCKLVEGCDTSDDGTTLAHPDGCDLFVECKDHLAIAKECPPKNIFDQSNGRCIAGDVGSCSPMENQCISRPDGQYEHDPLNCSRYFICHDEIMTVGSCPDWEIFLSDKGICFPGIVGSCTTNSVATMCDGRADGSVYPDLKDCSQFITCNNNRATTATCGRGNIYSPRHRQCLSGNFPNGQLLDLCSTEEDGVNLLYPGEDCQLYVRCESQLPKTEECLEGEIFTSSTGCVPGSSVTCKPNFTP